MKETEEILSQINTDLKGRKISPYIEKLTNQKLRDEPATRWAEAESCTMTKSKTEIKIELNFQLANPSSEIQVLESNAFRFWNATRNKVC